jgi:hypothetical protein
VESRPGTVIGKASSNHASPQTAENRYWPVPPETSRRPLSTIQTSRAGGGRQKPCPSGVAIFYIYSSDVKKHVLPVGRVQHPASHRFEAPVPVGKKASPTGSVMNALSSERLVVTAGPRTQARAARTGNPAVLPPLQISLQQNTASASVPDWSFSFFSGKIPLARVRPTALFENIAGCHRSHPPVPPSVATQRCLSLYFSLSSLQSSFVILIP